MFNFLKSYYLAWVSLFKQNNKHIIFILIIICACLKNCYLLLILTTFMDIYIIIKKTYIYKFRVWYQLNY